MASRACLMVVLSAALMSLVQGQGYYIPASNLNIAPSPLTPFLNLSGFIYVPGPSQAPTIPVPVQQGLLACGSPSSDSACGLSTTVQAFCSAACGIQYDAFVNCTQIVYSNNNYPAPNVTDASRQAELRKQFCAQHPTINTTLSDVPINVSGGLRASPTWELLVLVGTLVAALCLLS
ncbi:hypothetical protein KFL_002950050 [Klebsormidium nitens]|uniref:Uncharacterized protein n=1 Tax=Klebsormidium nitens TaxID=105231 RepID=A0A1Y1I7M2_KLENI|nr:hypothetical protein KFL_002950050 [Klebsormidium nitens]|eukprot:GAQ86533.1 hypothetical protein KFL_002950050 [Klebsormidium nitens]